MDGGTRDGPDDKRSPSTPSGQEARHQAPWGRDPGGGGELIGAFGESGGEGCFVPVHQRSCNGSPIHPPLRISPPRWGSHRCFPDHFFPHLCVGLSQMNVEASPYGRNHKFPRSDPPPRPGQWALPQGPGPGSCFTACSLRDPAVQLSAAVCLSPSVQFFYVCLGGGCFFFFPGPFDIIIGYELLATMALPEVPTG